MSPHVKQQAILPSTPCLFTAPTYVHYNSLLGERVTTHFTVEETEAHVFVAPLLPVTTFTEANSGEP